MKNVSEMIPQSEIDTWESGDNICIVAGTGKGKSYFIKTSLVEYARKKNRKILFLVHRTILKDQIQLEIEEMGIGDVFTVATYQYVEMLKSTEDDITLDYYDYIVSDEFHYFLADSEFNDATEISLNEVLESKAIRIFMSATPNDMIKYFKEYAKLDIKEYKMTSKYEFIRSLTFIYGIDRIKEATYKTIEKKKKTIIFSTAGFKRMSSLIDEFPSHIVYASENNSKLSGFVDKDKINKMIDEKRFEEEVLITTTAMDAGVSLFDRDIETIIIDIRDIGSIIQCLGRKRQIDPNDLVDLYIVIPPKTLLFNDLKAREYIVNALHSLENDNLIDFFHKFILHKYKTNGLDRVIKIEENRNNLAFKYNKLAKFKNEVELEHLKGYEEYESLDLGFVANMERIFSYSTAPILNALDKRYTNKWREEYNESRNLRREEVKKEKEENRIKESERLLQEDENIISLFYVTKKFLKSKRDKYLTATEKEILFRDLSAISQTPVTNNGKANKELKRLNLDFELYWKTVRHYKSKTKKETFVREIE